MRCVSVLVCVCVGWGWCRSEKMTDHSSFWISSWCAVQTSWTAFSLWPCLNTHLLLQGPAGFYEGKLKVNLLFREHRGAFGEVKAQSTLESYQSICTPAHSILSFSSAPVTAAGSLHLKKKSRFTFHFSDFPNIFLFPRLWQTQAENLRSI